MNKPFLFKNRDGSWTCMGMVDGAYVAIYGSNVADAFIMFEFHKYCFRIHRSFATA